MSNSQVGDGMQGELPTVKIAPPSKPRASMNPTSTSFRTGRLPSVLTKKSATTATASDLGTPAASTLSASSLSTASTPAPRRSDSSYFWGALHDVPLFAGPLGESVGMVPQRTVVREVSRHQDAFGGWWMSIECEDGTLAWVDFSGVVNDSSTVVDPEKTMWQRLYDSRPGRARTSRAGRGSSRSTSIPKKVQKAVDDAPEMLPAEQEPRKEPHFLFLEEDLYDYYWASLHRRNSTARDWNWEYQRALERYLHGAEFEGETPMVSSQGCATSSASTASREALEAIAEEFKLEVEHTVVQICKEDGFPAASRSILSHPRFLGQVYFNGRLMLKRLVDNSTGTLGSDEAAVKCGRAIYRNRQLLSMAAPRLMLHIPLHAICTFGGFTFLCCAIPPYGTTNLLAVSDCERTSHAKAVQRDEAAADAVTALAPTPSLVAALLQDLSEALHFEQGALPCEWRVYAGRDRRLYLSRTHRLLPPIFPFSPQDLMITEATDSSTLGTDDAGTCNGHTSSERLYTMIINSSMRPELLLRWPNPWPRSMCTHKLSGDAALQEMLRVSKETTSPSWQAGMWMKTDGITQLAGTVGLHFPLTVLPLPREVCHLCDGAIEENEIRFATCTAPSLCCRICMHCYARLTLGNPEAEAPADKALGQVCTEAVRCGARCRKVGSFVMVPSLTDLVHAHGLHLRHLAYVLHRLPRATRRAVEHFCHVEVVARAGTYLLRQDLLGAANPQDARAVCENFLTSLLQPVGAESEHFWRCRLGPALQRRFTGLCEPFHLSVHALRLVAERVSALSGVRLSEASLDSLELFTIITTKSSSDSGTLGAQQEDGPDTGEKNGTAPFLEVIAISPRTRAFPVPATRRGTPESPSVSPGPPQEANHVENGADNCADLGAIRSRLAQVLLFWIGHAPADALDGQQPFYLDQQVVLSSP